MLFVPLSLLKFLVTSAKSPFISICGNNSSYYQNSITEDLLLENQFNRLSKFVPEGTVVVLSANRNGVITSIANTKKRPVLSLSHTDFEDHSHPESTLMTNLNLNIAMDINQNSIFLYIKSNKKLVPLNKVIIN